MSKDLDRVREFVVDLHQFFTDWISGKLPKDETIFKKRLLDRVDQNLQLRMPGGAGFEHSGLTQMMYSLQGRNPGFAIKIRDVAIRHHIGEVFVVTYEEWQRGAMDSGRSNNARYSTVVLREKGDSFSVLHVHETWFEDDKMAAGDYNF